MSNENKVKYCSLDPDFPQKAFMIFLFILHHEQLLGTVPLEAIYQTPDSVSEGVMQTVKQFENIDNDITIPEECLLFPLTYQSDFPLRKEFWQKPSMEYNSQLRMKSFAPVIEHPNFYSLLVTPFTFDDLAKTWYHHAAFPLIDSKDTKAIEQFMFTSDHVVEPRAKNAAIYQIGKKIRFNWLTKEMQEFDKTAQKILDKSN